ncbi:MAG: hypothetical protein HOV77_11585 [Hamadaea sp.]|uniref:hypothetical protein n=1 Tax=Hamadaea sp. TaxID=2024425 RepID=UPI001855A07C|nr:hypothetical protein [Hamadaea sp.]NUT19821.1 hypothetical protein [Hamadaea sp.]
MAARPQTAIDSELTTGIATCGDHAGCLSFTDQFCTDHQSVYFGLLLVGASFQGVRRLA